MIVRHMFITVYFADIRIILEDDYYERCCIFFSACFGVAGGIGRPAGFFGGNSEISEILKKFRFWLCCSKTTHGGAFQHMDFIFLKYPSIGRSQLNLSKTAESQLK